MTDGAGTPPPQDYASADIALEEARKMAGASHTIFVDNDSSDEDGGQTAAVPSKAPATEDHKSVGADAKMVTDVELNTIRQRAFQDGVRSASTRGLPPAEKKEPARKVTGAQLEKMWEAGFEEGAISGGANAQELVLCRQAAAEERARRGQLASHQTTDVTPAQIQRLWQDAYAEGGRAGAGMHRQSVRASAREYERASMRGPQRSVREHDHRTSSKTRPPSSTYYVAPPPTEPSHFRPAWGTGNGDASRHGAAPRTHPPYAPQYPPQGQLDRPRSQSPPQHTPSRASRKKIAREEKRVKKLEAQIKVAERKLVPYGESPYQRKHPDTIHIVPWPPHFGPLPSHLSTTAAIRSASIVISRACMCCFVPTQLWESRRPTQRSNVNCNALSSVANIARPTTTPRPPLALSPIIYIDALGATVELVCVRACVRAGGRGTTPASSLPRALNCISDYSRTETRWKS